MIFENEFEVAGSPAQVIDKLGDVPLMASFLPGASVGPANEDGSYPGTLVVSFGPKRIAFKGTIDNKVDPPKLCGVLSGAASADVRGAKMSVKMDYSVAEVPGSSPPRTKVKFISNAELTGILAEFAKTGGVVVTNAILAEFAKNFSAQFDVPVVAADAAPGSVPAPAAAPATAEALSALSLMGVVIKSMFSGLAAAIGRAWRSIFSRP